LFDIYQIILLIVMVEQEVETNPLLYVAIILACVIALIILIAVSGNVLSTLFTPWMTVA